MESNTSTNTTTNHRARWAAIGAAVAVCVGAGGVGFVSATMQVAPVASGGQQLMSATRGFDVSEGVAFTAHLFCQVSPVPPAQLPANPTFADDSSLTATFAPS